MQLWDASLDFALPKESEFRWVRDTNRCHRTFLQEDFEGGQRTCLGLRSATGLLRMVSWEETMLMRVSSVALGKSLHLPEPLFPCL